jgi:hypothetical protein
VDQLGTTSGPFPQWLVDGSQVAGSLLNLVALVVALYAIVKTNRDLAEERLLTYELEILRELGAALHGDVTRVSGLLYLLPGNQDMPLTLQRFVSGIQRTRTTDCSRSIATILTRTGKT